MSDTIFALSSGQLPAAVAVMRVTGPEAGACLQRLAGDLPDARRAALRVLKDRSGEEIDQALVIWFPAPHSYTGEDIAEFHLHGGAAVVTKLSECLLEMKNVRLAEAGEFSLRAYRHGKMDLTQLEGLADMIDAKTEFQRRQAIKLKNGWNGQIYDDLRSRIIGLMSHVEAAIDFADEDLDAGSRQVIEQSVEVLLQEIDSHLKSSLNHETLRDGFRVVLAGAVNVGKSSLLNRLAMRDAAIVSEQAGTTRDIIEIHMDLGGYPVIIQDTAGIRPTDNKVETIGIARSKSAMDKADLIVAVGDHLCPSQDISSLCPVGKNLIHVRNKIDIAPHEGNDENVFAISVLKDEGVDALIAAIAEMVKDGFTQRESGLILRLRHRDHLEKCLDALARIGAHGEDEVDLIGEDIREAAAHVGAITGKIDVEDMLDRVFSEFCIGK